MKYEGDVYRPPSEARSLIIQVTIGCSHNRCTFCHMYTDKQFRIRRESEIMEDLRECRELYRPYVKRIFFADGDALSVPTELLLRLLNYVKENFPLAERISSYGTAKDVLQKSEDELYALREAGLEMVYLGGESGDNAVLTAIQKQESAEEIIAAGQKLRRTGIRTSVTLISGLGGKAGLKRHAVKSAEMINQMQPDYCSLLALHLAPSSPMSREIERGERELLGPDDIVTETEIFLRHIDSPDTVFRSNHASNYVALKGNFNQDIPRLLRELRQAKEQQKYRTEEWRRRL